MEKKEKFLIEVVKEPFINTALVAELNPTVLEFVTAVRQEAAGKYPGALNEKCQLVIDGVRHSIAIVCRNLSGNYILVNRESIGKNPLANKNNREEELARLRGVDFPLASRGILPDSSFKVDDILDEMRISEARFIGMAKEDSRKLGARGDTGKVVMPCYEVDLEDEIFENEGRESWGVFKVDDILDLEDYQCSSKVLVLKKYLLNKINNTFNL